MNETAADVLALLLLSPAYAAVTVPDSATAVVSTQLPLPDANVAVQVSPLLAVTVTLPVASCVAVSPFATVMLTVIARGVAFGAITFVMVVVVLIGFTVSDTLAVDDV